MCAYSKVVPRKYHPKHGLDGTGQYKSWEQMKARCLNPNTHNYRNYGGRGITVCDKWLTFHGFWEDMKDGYFKGATIDRKDNERGYYKDNCRWATMSEQCNNRRGNRILSFNGETHTLTEWARKLNLTEDTIRCRIKRGWSIDEVLTLPHGYRHPSKKPRNRRVKYKYYLTHNGETLTIAKWSEKIGLKPGTIRNRIRRGLTIDEVISLPRAYKEKG